MSSMPWIKLYTEILNDPKMGKLEDHLWRRAIELFLMAGEFDQEGLLPPLDDIAWKLRVSEENMELELTNLQNKTGIVQNIDGRWYVVKFAERQGRRQDEKQAAWRERQQKSREKAEMSRVTDEDVTRDTGVTLTPREDKSRVDVDVTRDNDNNVDQPFMAMSVHVANTAKVSEFTPTPRSWTETINRLLAEEIIPEDITEAVGFMTDRKLPINGAQSLLGPARVAKSNRLRGANGNGKAKLDGVRLLNGV